MTRLPIDRCTLSYTVGHVAGQVCICAEMDTDLYTKTRITEMAQTLDGAKRKIEIAAEKCRNGRPRLVSITRIAGLEGRAA